jgi:hypothetical protein
MSTSRNSVARGPAPRLAGLLGALVLPAMLLGSCGGGVGEAALVVPFITFQFEGFVPIANGLERASFSLDSNDVAQGRTSGAITARLSIGDARADATGTYAGTSLQVNLTGPVAAPLAPAYGGQFVEPDTIVLTPTSGTQPAVTVVRADNSFRPVLHDSRWTGRDAGSGQAWKVHFVTDPVASEFDATAIFTGEETVAGKAGAIRGHVVMRRIEIDVVRNGQTVRLSGRMGPAGQTPPANPPEPAPAQTITFGDGSTLARD